MHKKFGIHSSKKPKKKKKFGILLTSPNRWGKRDITKKKNFRLNAQGIITLIFLMTNVIM